MTVGVVGRKCGMTQIFTEAGESVPVTVIHVDSNRVVQVKSLATDGYNALQVTAGNRKQSRVNKALSGHFAKAKTGPGNGLWEFRLEDEATMSPGDEISVSIFTEGQPVDVTGTSKGKGFAGSIKRHNFGCQPHSHGNSVSHRVHGSTGQNQSPRKVFKGKKMAGHMGNVQRTVQNQIIAKIDVERSVIMIKGVVPGAKGSDIIIRPAVKAARQEGGK